MVSFVSCKDRRPYRVTKHDLPTPLPIPQSTRRLAISPRSQLASAFPSSVSAFEFVANTRRLPSNFSRHSLPYPMHERLFPLAVTPRGVTPRRRQIKRFRVSRMRGSILDREHGSGNPADRSHPTQGGHPERDLPNDLTTMTRRVSLTSQEYKVQFG